MSIAPAVRIFPLPAMISVDGPMTSSGCTPSMVSGLPALPMATIRPSRMPTSALTTPQWSRIDRAGDDGVRRALGPGGPRLAHRLADHLAATEDRLVAAGAVVGLDLDEQVGVGEPDPVPGGRPVQRRVARSVHRGSQRSAGGRRAGRGRSGRRRAVPGSPRGSRPARTARRCRPVPRAAGPTPPSGRSAARDWPRRSGSASRPAPAGRRCSRRPGRSPGDPR